MQKIYVVAGIIFRADGNFLIAKRADHSSNAGKWEFPGGKIELNETPKIALIREIKEELNLSIHSLKHFLSYEIKNGNTIISFTIFTCSVIVAEITLIDHDEIQWIKIAGLPSPQLFMKADLPILEKLIEGNYSY